MTPQQKIKWAVVPNAVEMGYLDVSMPEVSRIAGEYIDELCDRDEHHDPENEVRVGEVETDLPCEYSRHYKSKAVASRMPDGSWVGWTYWYGGGEHANPSEVGRMEGAYDLACVERQDVVIVREFTRIEETK
ncbi:MAG: hypothetical protein IBX56_20200 [Methylomicrobium sp.]|nr:hypothetical protein [Methylomicrobium sp.]